MLARRRPDQLAPASESAAVSASTKTPSTGGMAERHVRELLELAQVEIGGHQPWDIQVHDDRLYRRVLSEGSLGLGESYMDGWWDCASLDAFMYRVLRADLDREVSGRYDLLLGVLSVVGNLQSKTRAWMVGQQHYDLDNRLYERMLDKRMVYTCGYWQNATSLDQAQEDKLELVCRKLRLKPGDKLLDIGCGWGGLAEYAARNFGVSVVGLTISEEQAKLARERCAGLDVEVRLLDYRDIDERFDHVVSLGMFEHVGWKNYATYMEVVHNCLKDDGLFLLHTIGANRTHFGGDPWIDRYIFPNGELPSLVQIGKAIEGRFVMEDWHNFGADYDKTLMAWHANVDAAWDELGQKYDERFRRMWRYYLLTCAGSFRARRNQLWQVVLSKSGVRGGYRAPR